MDEPPAGDGATVGGAMAGGAMVGGAVVDVGAAALVLPGLAALVVPTEWVAALVVPTEWVTALVVPTEWVTVRCGFVVGFVGSTDDRTAAPVRPALDVLAPELLARAFVALGSAAPDPPVAVVTAGTAEARGDSLVWPAAE